MKKVSILVTAMFWVLAGCQTSSNMQSVAIGPQYTGLISPISDIPAVTYKPYKSSELSSHVKFVVSFSGMAEEGVLESDSKWSSEVISSSNHLKQFYTGKTARLIRDGEVSTYSSNNKFGVIITKRADGKLIERKISNPNFNSGMSEVSQFLLPLDKVFETSQLDSSNDLFTGQVNFNDEMSMALNFTGSAVGITQYEGREAIVARISGKGDFRPSNKIRVPMDLHGYALVDVETGHTLVEDIQFTGRGSGDNRFMKVTITSNKKLAM